MRRCGRPGVGALLAVVGLWAGGCGAGGGANDSSSDGSGAGGATSDGGASPICVPSQDEYEATIRPILESRCGRCHGEVPDQGAPFSLLSYPPLIEEHDAGRIVDRIVDRVASGVMPPGGNPRPTEEEFHAIIDWASCGNRMAQYPQR